MVAVFSAPYAYAESNASGVLAISPVVDDIWVIVVAACVMIMQVGLLLRTAGSMRPKDMLMVARTNILGFALAVITFAVVGVTLAFGRSDGLPFGSGPGFTLFDDLVSGQPALVLFQLMLGGVAVTIFSGSVAERISLKALILACLFMAGLIYPVFLHWAHGDRLFPNLTAFLANLDFVDLAGGVSIHATAGWIALAACMVVSPRTEVSVPGGSRIQLHGRNAIVSAAGALLLVVGWAGLNGGLASTYGASVPAVIANSLLAAGMGACIACLIALRTEQRILPERLIIGMLGGLAAISTGSGLLDITGALITGGLGGLVAIFGNAFVAHRLKVSDPTGVIGVHAFSGAAGALLLPLIVSLAHLPADGRL